MGMKIQYESYQPGHFSMRELKEDSTSCSWSPYYGDRVFASGQHYLSGIMARGVINGFSGYDKDTLKKKMLEHEAIFKNQVYELHRLYRIQRDMMDEVKKKELQHGIQLPFSKSLVQSAGSQKCQDFSSLAKPNFFLEDGNSGYSSIKGCDMQVNSFPLQRLTNECRPTKVRRKMFDLQLPAEEYIGTEEDEKLREKNGSDTTKTNRNCVLSFGSELCNRSTYLADLNEPVEIEDTDELTHSDFVNKMGQESKKNPEALMILDKTSAWVKNMNGKQFFSQTKNAVDGKSNPPTVNFPLDNVSSSYNSSQGFHKQSRSYTSYLHSDDDLRNKFGLSLSERLNDKNNGNHQDVLGVPYSVSASLLTSWEKVNLCTNKTPSLGHGMFSDRLSSSSIESKFTKELPVRNGFYHGSASGAKDQDQKNSYKTGRQHNFEVIDVEKSEENHHTTIHWLSSKPPPKFETADLNLNLNSDKGFARMNGSSSVKTELSADKSLCLKSESGSKKKLLLDMNFPSADQITAEFDSNGKKKDSETGKRRCLFDLNSCTNEDEFTLDLEADEQGRKESETQDENMKQAAEIIVSISFPTEETSLIDDLAVSDSLMCFADVVCSSLGVKDCENKDQIAEGFDYFETMTLNLAEMKPEDFMPKPLVPDNLKLDEIVSTPNPCRTRKVQSRRGRQRRDFRRDILPGLTSLSRHEVTEDLQVFGSLMRATGHLWTSGLTRRNTVKSRSTRGRRQIIVASRPCTPLIQQFNTIEVSLEDRNLTGWGKTTRRPRRQRCPATGNSTPLPLTLKGRGFD